MKFELRLQPLETLQQAQDLLEVHIVGFGSRLLDFFLEVQHGSLTSNTQG